MSAPAACAAASLSQSLISTDRSVSVNSTSAPLEASTPRRTEAPLPAFGSLRRTCARAQPANPSRARSAVASLLPSSTTISSIVSGRAAAHSPIRARLAGRRAASL